MDSKQFSAWLDDFAKRWPDTGGWIRSKPETLAIWFDESFQHLDFEDALAVSRVMFSDSEVKPWDREQIPRIWFRRAQELRFARDRKHRESVERRKRDGSPRSGGEQRIGAALDDVRLRTILEDAREIKDPEQRQAMISERVDQAWPEERHVPTLCELCHSTGIVSVWDPRVVEQVVNGDERVRPARPYVAACRCKRGDDRADGERALPRVGNGRLIPVVTGICSRDLELAESLKPAGYVDAFDDWNERG